MFKRIVLAVIIAFTISISSGGCLLPETLKSIKRKSHTYGYPKTKRVYPRLPGSVLHYHPLTRHVGKRVYPPRKK